MLLIASGIVERRGESIVAPQALYLMNDPLLAGLARGLAERVAREIPGGNDRERVSRLYEIALGRPPIEAEVDVGVAVFGEATIRVAPQGRGTRKRRRRWQRRPRTLGRATAGWSCARMSFCILIELVYG